MIVDRIGGLVHFNNKIYNKNIKLQEKSNENKIKKLNTVNKK